MSSLKNRKSKPIMKKYFVYLDVLGYSGLAKKDNIIPLKKIKKFYEIISRKNKKNVLLLYSDCAQLIFDSIDDAFESTAKIYQECYKYNKKCYKAEKYDSMIFLRGGITIDKKFKLIPVSAKLNKKSYAGMALADAYDLEKKRRGITIFLSTEVIEEYGKNTKLKNNYYCY